MSDIVGDETILEGNAVKSLILIFHLGLTFSNHLKVICKKKSKKLTAIIILANALSECKSKLRLSLNLNLTT